MKTKLLTALLVLILAVPFVFGGCNTASEAPAGEGFAVYLTRDNIPVDKMEMQSHVEIAESPAICAGDIISYDGDTHEIELTPEAFERIYSLQVPTSGASFVVCVDKQPVYWGAFWVGFSSQSFDGVTIMTKPPFPGDNRIRISLGYPSEGFYRGEDPRPDPQIMASLEAMGKLK